MQKKFKFPLALTACLAALLGASPAGAQVFEDSFNATTAGAGSQTPKGHSNEVHNDLEKATFFFDFSDARSSVSGDADDTRVVELKGVDYVASIQAGGDGKAVDLSKGIYALPLQIDEPWEEATLFVRVRAADGFLDGGLMSLATKGLDIMVSAFHIDWGERGNLGVFARLGSVHRPVHAPLDLETGDWMDICVRWQPRSEGKPDTAVWAGFTGWTEVFVNGRLISRRCYRGPPPGAYDRNNRLTLGVDFEGQRFRGLVDHVALWDRALDNREIARLFKVGHVDTNLPAEGPLNGWNQEVGNAFFPKEMPRKERFEWIKRNTAQYVKQLRETDRAMYPTYHLTLPGFQYNTHGFYFNDRWHLFPVVSMGGARNLDLEQLFWAHLSSDDLLKWKVHTPLMPERFDANGAFYIDRYGTPSVVAGDAGPGVGYAVAKDDSLDEWEVQNRPKLRGNAPVIQQRNDPAVFQKNDRWYMVASGVSTERESSNIHLYRSENGIDWTYVKLLFEAEVGVGVQECLVAFIQNDLLVMSTNKALVQDSAANGHDYIVGRFENESFELLGSGISDYGYNSNPRYRPYNMWHGFTDDTGRTVVWQYQGRHGNNWEALRKGWFSTYSLPREIRIRDDYTLAFLPARELEELRNTSEPGKSFREHKIDGFKHLGTVSDTSENRISVTPGESGNSRLKFAKGSDEFTLSYSAHKERLILTQNRSSAASPDNQPYSVPLRLNDKEEVSFTLYLDRSMIEIYTPEGDVLSAWFRTDEVGDFTVEAGSMKEIKVHSWKMNPLQFD
ncbi:GH32 C-terminal domain-containing protein [Kiritimatiella glycovorans]|uniref:beta-fructofuranosidase n=1 Tax=Kiritimatiella glycovorans TaxID=1307763 RepID=A0A0G3EJJ0_9BACT|nr:GH32 C-terminal domain-containing protein [Kiritimatiella glycovorans]AKJ65617.1 Sucrose-6-phosphate hydrolase [Kiritimatiella glycovorans]